MEKNSKEIKQFSVPEQSIATHHLDTKQVQVKQKKCEFSFRYFDEKHECLSAWDKKSTKCFVKWLRTASNQEVTGYRNSGNCHKHQGKVPGVLIKQRPPMDGETLASEDEGFYSFQLNDTLRVHGFFDESMIYVLILDKNHKIHDGKNKR